MKKKNERKAVIYLKAALNEDNGSVIALSEQELIKLYNDNPNLENIHEAFAETERIMSSERIKRDLQRKKELKVTKSNA
jgi:DNA invertase Pin-like site-specific DNA recombinase